MALPRTAQDPWRATRIVLCTAPLLYGLLRAARISWLADDAFISFRYVDNWARGLGLVYNAGERVEGYTHFLWVVLLGGLHGLGFGLEALGTGLPLLCWAGLLALLFVHAVRRRGAANGTPQDAWLALPVAAWAVALHHDAQVYATSGLETSLFALLLAGGLLLVAGRRPRLDLAAVVYALAVLTRPEGALYAATAGFFILYRTRSGRAAARFALLWGGLLVPWIVWKTVYYGTPIPNTYYAKSAALSHWSQGWEYTRLYFAIYPVLLVAAAAALGGWIVARRRARPVSAGTTPAHADLVPLALVQVLLTVLYVTRVGGDFMFARFYVPVTPLLVLAAEEAIHAAQRRWASWGLAALLVGGTLAVPLLRDRIFTGPNLVHGITDEPKWYRPDVVRDLRHQGDVLRRLTAGTSLRMVVPAGRAMVAYFGQLPYAVEGTGLTDAEIARMPIAQRGRPGHEKGPSDDFMRRRRVPLYLLWGAHRAVGLPPMEQVQVEDVYFRLVYYDVAVMDLLARRGARFIDIPAYLDRYLGEAPRLDPNKVRRDFADFERFYFQHNDDPVRQARFAALAGGAALSPGTP